MWKRLRLSGDDSPKFLSALFEHFGADAGCDDAVIVHVGRSGQYGASRHQPDQSGDPRLGELLCGSCDPGTERASAGRSGVGDGCTTL
jgi:hypothetical protein